MDLKELDSHSSMRHPWEISRAEFLLNEIRKLKISRIIDIGAGDGYLAQKIQMELGIPVLLVDVNFSADQIKQSNYFKNFTDIRPADKDLLLLADVLEHIEDPKSFLRNLKKHFAPESEVLITVPAFQKLFSEHDVFLGHFKRYNHQTLLEDLKDSIHVSYMRYLFFLPLIIRILQVVFGNKNITKQVASWKYAENSPQTLLVLKLLSIDSRLSFLPGLSLMALGRFTR